MSFALLWIETLLAATLFAVALIALGARRQSRVARILLDVLALLLPALPLGYFAVICGIMRFGLGVHGDAFWASLLLFLAFLGMAISALIKALRPDATGLRRAFSWPVGRITVGFVVCLTLLGMTFWNLALQTQIEIQALRTQAGALALSVAPPMIPDSDNAAPLYQQAIRQYNAALTDQDKKTEYRDLDPRSPEVAAYLERQQKTLGLVRRAADLPQYRPDFPFTNPSDSEIGAMMHDAVSLRNQSNLLVIAATAESAAGRVDLALDDCRRLYAMGAHIGSAPLLTNGLVAIALDAQASKTTARILPAVSAKESLDRLPPLEPGTLSRMFARCLRSEEAFSLARLCDIGNGQLGALAGDYTPRISLARAAALWMLWIRDDVSIYRDGMQRLRGLADQPYYQSLPQWNQIAAESKLPANQRRGILAANILPSLAVSFQGVTDAQALRTCTALAIAATRYRLAHNEYPPSAQALVPDFLDSVPLDPFDGQPLRYLKNPDHSLTLYSIGPDLTDNHGTIEQKKNAPRPPDTGLTLKPGP